MKRIVSAYWLIGILLILSSCATFYQQNIEFNELVTAGEFAKAGKKLEGSKQFSKDRNEVLRLLNLGFINHIQGEFAKSNEAFNHADLLIETYKKQPQYEVLALVANPMLKPYQTEDFESVMVNYYKALNYSALGQTESALVEARKVNIKLNQLNDKYKKKNRYYTDPFMHNLMGMIYESDGDWNNAFIAYRNAYEVYAKAEGGSYFGVGVPEQLKRDLINSAAANGFKQEEEKYRQLFGIAEKRQPTAGGYLILFWQNGLGPIKTEWSINFTVLPGSDGFVTFANEEFGFNFPFYLGNSQNDELSDLSFVRVAFPKYKERGTYFDKATVSFNGGKRNLELAEDVNELAFSTLQDRFLREMSSALLRLAIKKSSELALRQQNEYAGAILSITNAITERADTRNWQTLPHSVHYARIPLDTGQQQVALNLQTAKGANQQVTFDVYGNGRIQFLPYHSLENLPAGVY